MKPKKRRSKERLAIRKRVSPGASPGTLVADPEMRKTTIRVLSYGPDRMVERVVDAPDELKDVIGKLPVTWIDVDGLGDTQMLEHLGKVLGVHPLALEDVVNLYQRPKVEEYPPNLFIVVRMASQTEGRIHTEQLSLFLGDGFLITFQGEHPGDCLDPVRRRVRHELGRIRTQGADYLAYALIDAVVDNYFPIVDEFGESLEHLEDELIERPVSDATERVQRGKQDLLLLRRALVPLRDVANALIRDESAYIRPETRVYLRDCYDHTVQLLDVVNTYRELAGGLMELHLSSVSNRMNEIMKFLTLVSTVFIPLTFIAGVYGMNFDPQRSPWNMPEIEFRYGYPVVMAVMVVVAILLIVYFRRKGWVGPTR